MAGPVIYRYYSGGSVLERDFSNLTAALDAAFIDIESANEFQPEGIEDQIDARTYTSTQLITMYERRHNVSS